MELREDLKPCPFCGTLPTTAINYSRCGGGELRLTYSVVCPRCKITKSLGKESEGKSFKEYINAMNSVITIWNSRVEVDGNLYKR